MKASSAGFARMELTLLKLVEFALPSRINWVVDAALAKLFTSPAPAERTTIFVPEVISAGVSAGSVRYCKEFAAAKSVMTLVSASLLVLALPQMISAGAAVGVGGTGVASGVGVAVGVRLMALQPVVKATAVKRPMMIRRRVIFLRNDID